MAERWEPKERKSFPFELEDKALNLEERMFAGFAAVMGNFDGKDVIEKGAFKKTIQEMGKRIKVYWIHDWKNPIGRILELTEVPRSKLPQKILDRAPDATGGLFVKGQLDEVPEGERALVQMRSGTLDEMSIGFDTVKEEWGEYEDFGEVRHIKEVKLYDISPVPLAMNPAAQLIDVKSEKVEVTDDYIHVPVPGEEGKHSGEGHRVRTITISEEQGIQARRCFTCKVNFSYIFAKEKGWTVAKAVAWVKAHAKGGDMVSTLLEYKFAGSPRNRFGTHSSYKFKGNYASAWRCHFSKVGGGGTSGTATGPIRGTVRRTEMIAAAMKPPCNLPSTESIGARGGPKSPLDCSFPSKASDYGLDSWDKPETDADREGVKLSCKDLAVIKRAALAEIKRRAQDRESEGKDFEPEEPFEEIDGDPLLEDLERLIEEAGLEPLEKGVIPKRLRDFELHKRYLER